MEKQIEKLNFDLTKKAEKVIKEVTSDTTSKFKKLKIAAFLAIGGMSIGFGLGLANGLMDSYKISSASHAKIEEIQAKNDSVLKAKKNEIDAAAYARKVQAQEIIDKENAQKEKQLLIEQDKLAYDIWMKNKNDVIENYENQLTIYDKAYQDIVQGVKTGVLGLDTLSEVRAEYQQYKKDLYEKINYIEKKITTFENFHALNKENRDYLDQELLSYQNGNLNRRTELEDKFMERISQQTDDAKREKNRIELRDKIIDDLTDLMNNNNATTKTKKLKR